MADQNGKSKGPGHGGPARGYSWPPFEKGNTKAMTHGCYSAKTLAPMQQELAAELREAMGPIYSPQFEGTVAAASLALSRLHRAEMWLDEHGMIDEDGELRPLTRMIGQWQAEARRSLEMLTLTPLSQAKLGLSLQQARGAALEAHLKEVYDG
jgi:hypothetical protein